METFHPTKNQVTSTLLTDVVVVVDVDICARQNIPCETVCLPGMIFFFSTREWNPIWGYKSFPNNGSASRVFDFPKKKKTNNDNKMEGIRCFFPTALLTINSHFQLFLIRKVLFSIAASFFKLNLFKKSPLLGNLIFLLCLHYVTHV